MANRQKRKGKQMTEIELNPEYLTYALMAMPSVLTAEYCYPNFWAIETKKGHFDLGTANGVYGWNSQDGQIVGETEKETVAGVCLAFEEFLVNLTNEGENK